MDDEEVLLDVCPYLELLNLKKIKIFYLQNDPLAIYLKNQNIHDFETAELFPIINNQHELQNDDTIIQTCEVLLHYMVMRSIFAVIRF